MLDYAKRAKARALARRLNEEIRATNTALWRLLSIDPRTAIETHTNVAVKFDDIAAQQSECTIAAVYIKGEKPEIVVAPSLSQGRSLFSLLHEFCHYLIESDAETTDYLFFLNAELAGELEEAVCDAFASDVLVPEKAVEASVDVIGASAYALIELYSSTEASREAAAVALAERFRSPGYAIIGLPGDQQNPPQIQFAASGGGAYNIKRGTPQPGTLLQQASSVSRATGREGLRYPSGALTEEMHGQVVLREGYLFAVYLVDRPSWGSFRLSETPSHAGYVTAWCDNCSKSFRPREAGCQICNEHVCPTCNRCSCEAAGHRNAQVCTSCWLEHPPHLFREGATVCNLCIE